MSVCVNVAAAQAKFYFCPLSAARACLRGGWGIWASVSPIGPSLGGTQASWANGKRAVKSQRRIEKKKNLRREVRMSSGVERSVAASERGVPAVSRPS